MRAPCKGCEDRVAGCHGKCKKYTSWREKVAKAREVARMESKGERDAREHHIDVTLKAKRQWRK